MNTHLTRKGRSQLSLGTPIASSGNAGKRGRKTVVTPLGSRDRAGGEGSQKTGTGTAESRIRDTDGKRILKVRRSPAPQPERAAFSPVIRGEEDKSRRKEV